MGVDKKRKLSKAPAGQPKRRKTQSGGGQKKAASLDSLRWKSVEVPDMFEDLEGFFGLEEIDGVDIVKDGDTIRFMAPKQAVQEEGEEFEGFDDAPEETGESPSTGEKATGDDKPVGKKAASKDQKKDSKKESKKDVKKESKKEDKKAQEKKAKANDDKDEDAELESNVFANAGDISEEPDEDFDISGWLPLDLSPQLLSSIARLKFSKPTTIQASAIPQIMNGHDVVGKAATGSGKTLAFGIPIVETWLSRTTEEASEGEKKTPIALILSPTRELAHQISDHIKALCAGLPTSPYICSVTGGLSLQKQQRQLEKADIIIGTPGRMWEIMSSSNATMYSLRGISFLVVDEADRLLQDGHFKEAEEILKALDKTGPKDEDEGSDDEDAEETHKRQTLVFSATLNKNLQQKLAGKSKFNLTGDSASLEYLLQKLNFREEKPKFIDANPVSQMADKLREGLIMCGDMEKDLYLYATILLQPTRRTLVFTNSINSVKRLTPLLQALNLPAFPLHSNMIQKARLRSLERFKAAESPKNTNPNNNNKAKTQAFSPHTNTAILIATDVAARGLDIPDVDMVIHYHVPRSADDYVHRSGRTARASNSGISVLLCGPKEAVPTQRLVAKVHASKHSQASSKSKKMQALGSGMVRTVDVDRKLVSRLKERVAIAKAITDSQLAKEKVRKDDDWVKKAAEDLGLEYDEDEMDGVGSWSGRGRGRKEKEKTVAREVTKAELAGLKAQLRDLLSRRVNTGVSERYLTGGGAGVDLDAMLRGDIAGGGFLGRVDGLGFDDFEDDEGEEDE